MKKVIAITILLILPFSLFALFDVHYIDVGEADFIVIVCDGQTLVIDGGHQSQQGQRVNAVLLKYAPTGKIDYYIGTHAHEDHMGAAASVLSYVERKGQTIKRI